MAKFFDDLIPKPWRREYPPWLTPVVGGLATLSLGGYIALFGGGRTAVKYAIAIVLCTASVKLLSYMEYVDSPDHEYAIPSAKITVALLITSTLLFWLPVVGLGLISYSLYRARWLEVNDWLLFPFSCLFFLSAGITLVWGIFFGLDGAVLPPA